MVINGVDLVWNWISRFIRNDSLHRRRRTRISGLEQLEPRIVLSANATVVLRGGSLIVTGTDPVTDYGSNLGAAIFVRQNGPGSFLVQNGNGTLNGKYDIGEFIGVSRDLRFSFGSGDDSLTFDQTTSITVSGNVTINGGGGCNTVSSEFHNDVLGAPPVPGSLKIGGFLSILSAGGHSVGLSNLNVRRDVSVRNLANGADASGAGLLTQVSIGVSEPTRRSQIGGNLLIANGPSLNEYKDQTFLDSVDVRGDVTIRNQAKNATVEMGSSTEKTTIRGSLQITNGPGELYQTNLTSVDVKKDVQIKNQGLITVTNIGAIDGQTSIAGDVRIVNLSGKSNTTEMQVADTTIQRTNVGKNLQVSGTNAGRQTILLLSSTINGATHLQTGKGDDEFFFKDAVFGGDFMLQSGGGNDVVSIGTTSQVSFIAFRPEERTGTRRVPQIEIDPVTGKTHIVYVEVQYTYTVLVPYQIQVPVSAGPVKFNRRTRVRFGPGDDVLNLANDAIATFQKKAVVNGQKGNNTAKVGTGKVVGRASLKHFLDAE